MLAQALVVLRAQIREAALSERREESNGVPVGVTQVCEALTPEGIPGLGLALEACVDDARVRRVYVGGVETAESQHDSLTNGGRQVRLDLPDQLLRVPHQLQPAMHRGFYVLLAGIRDFDAEQAIEAEGRRLVGGSDPDRLELGHARTLLSADPRVGAGWIGQVSFLNARPSERCLSTSLKGK